MLVYQRVNYFKLRLIAGKIIYPWWIFQQAMFDEGHPEFCW
jgi:hypothetical protein